MASKIVEVMAKEKKVLDPFVAWYKKNYDTKLAILSFFSLPFAFQVGIFMDFFEETYNYSVSAERGYYVINFPNIELAKDVINSRPGKVLTSGHDNVEYADFNSSMLKTLYNYERGMIKIVELIVNPF